MSKIVFFDSRYAFTIINIFRSLFFEYNGMSGSPTGFNYLAAKDSIKWNGLDIQETIPLIKNMFIAYRNNLS